MIHHIFLLILTLVVEVALQMESYTFSEAVARANVCVEVFTSRNDCFPFSLLLHTIDDTAGADNNHTILCTQ